VEKLLLETKEKSSSPIQLWFTCLYGSREKLYGNAEVLITVRIELRR